MKGEEDVQAQKFKNSMMEKMGAFPESFRYQVLHLKVNAPCRAHQQKKPWAYHLRLMLKSGLSNYKATTDGSEYLLNESKPDKFAPGIRRPVKPACRAAVLGITEPGTSTDYFRGP